MEYKFKNGDKVVVKPSMRDKWMYGLNIGVTIARRAGHRRDGMPLYRLEGNMGIYSEEWFCRESEALTEPTNELLHGVFQIESALSMGERSNLCYVAYVRLVGISRGAAIERLREKLAKDYQVPMTCVTFQFWCDGWSSAGGSALRLTL